MQTIKAVSCLQQGQQNDQQSIHQNTTPMTNFQTFLNNQQLKECRICLGPGQTPSNALIQPCNCNGSILYAHQSCIKQWVEISLKNKSRYQFRRACLYGLQCQTCRYLIKFKRQDDLQCRSCQNLLTQVRYNKFIFMIIIISFFGSMVGVFFCSLILIKHYMQNKASLSAIYILALCGCLLLTVIFMVSGIVFINQFLLVNTSSIKKIYGRALEITKSSLIKICNSNKVHPASQQNTIQNIGAILYDQ